MRFQHWPFLPTGKELALAGRYQGSPAVQFLELVKKNIDTIETATVGCYHGAAFSPDGKLLAVGDGRDVTLWDPVRRHMLMTLKGHQADVRTLAFSPDGLILATESIDKTVRLWGMTVHL